MNTAVLERSELGTTIFDLPIVVPVASDTPKTDALLEKWQHTSYEGWDAGSRAIVEGWNLHEEKQARGDDIAAAETVHYPVELLGRVERRTARSEGELERVWALRDRGIADPESLDLEGYTAAYWQLSDEAYTELRAERPGWQKILGLRRGKDKRLAAKAAECLLLGGEADDLLKPDVSLVPRSNRRKRAEEFIQRTGWLSSATQIPDALDGIQTGIGKWAERSTLRRKVAMMAAGAAAAGAMIAGLTAGAMEVLPSEKQLADIAASLAGLDDVQSDR